MLRWLVGVLRASWDLLIAVLSFVGLVGDTSSIFEALGEDGFFSLFVNWLYGSIVNYPIGWGLAVLVVVLLRHIIVAVPQKQHKQEAQKKRKHRSKSKNKGRRK